MLIAINWLRQIFAEELPTDLQIATDLCATGTETTLIVPQVSWHDSVVVAEILSAEKHPNADRLKVCQVTDGTEEWQIVCGASNARAGIKVALAKIGAVLPKDFKIKKSKIRSVESEGMLCAASELDISNMPATEGIMELDNSYKLGDFVATALKLNASIFDCELTVNRPDCLSVFGLAREIGAIYNLKPNLITKTASQPAIKPSIQDKINITTIKEKCPKYSATVIKSVDANKPTPSCILAKLRASDIASHNVIIDIGNFVMLEMGQPLHMFDLDKIDGDINIRLAQKDEPITLLNNNSYKLKPSSLVIADAKKPLALAGIMGDINSACTKDTTNILLECAFFMPDAIAGQAISYGLHTDASHRFERGVDPTLVEQATARAIALIVEFAGGEVGTTATQEYPELLPKAPTITVTYEYINRLLGTEISPEQIKDLLTRIECKVTINPKSIEATPPSYRFDLQQAVDLVEEIARLHGLDKIANKTLLIPAKLATTISKNALLDKLVVALSAEFHEVINYSFVEEELLQAFGLKSALKLQNPIVKNQGAMRTNLLPSIVKNIQYNRTHGANKDLCLFESAFVYKGDVKNVVHNMQLAGVIAQGKLKDWFQSDKCNFYWLKSFISNLLSQAPIANLSFQQESSIGYYHPAQCASIKVNDTTIGHIGFLHPTISQSLAINDLLLAFELDFDKIYEIVINSAKYQHKPISKMPIISRDFAFIAKNTVDFATIEQHVATEAGKYLQHIKLFDVYTGSPLQDDETSFAINCSWRHPDKTLTSKDIDKIATKIITKLQQNDIKLRDM